MVLPSTVSIVVLEIACILVIAKFCMTIFRLFRNRWYLLDLTRKLDDAGLETSFLWGNLKCVPPQDHPEHLDKILEVWKRLTNLGRDWIVPFFCIVQVVNPEYIKLAVANADSKNNIIYNMLRPWLGDGLLTSEGSRWMLHRRLLTPAFHFEILRPYVEIFVESTGIFLDKLSETNGKSVDVFRPVSLMTLDSLLKCSFSYDSKCQLDGKNEYTDAVFEVTDLIVTRFRFVPYHIDSIFHLSPSGFKWRRCIGILHGKSEDAIRKRRQALKEMEEKGKGATRDYGATKRGKYMDFLDILLQARDENDEGLSDLEIREEVDTFMFEGHDTTSSGISWCLYNLARFPEFQQKCHDEVQQLLAEKERTKLEWDDLNSLPFTTMFIKESLRFHTPVPAILRTLIKEVTFPDGTVLPKGTFVSVSPLATHHHPLFWEDPEEFDPYRFLPERNKDRHSHAFIPFSAGPRNCIGQNFAMNELKVVTAMTAQRFKIEVDPEKVPQWTPRLVLRSLNAPILTCPPDRYAAEGNKVGAFDVPFLQDHTVTCNHEPDSVLTKDTFVQCDAKDDDGTKTAKTASCYFKVSVHDIVILDVE